MDLEHLWTLKITFYCSSLRGTCCDCWSWRPDYYEFRACRSASFEVPLVSQVVENGTVRKKSLPLWRQSNLRNDGTDAPELQVTQSLLRNRLFLIPFLQEKEIVKFVAYSRIFQTGCWLFWVPEYVKMPNFMLQEIFYCMLQNPKLCVFLQKSM